MKKKHVLTSFILLSVLLLFSCKDAKDAAITKVLDLAAVEINKQCPIEASYGVKIDSCTVSDTKTLKFFITIALIDADHFDSKEFENLSKPSIIQTIQSREDLKKLRDLEVSFIYAYHDEKGKLVGEVLITPEDYNKPLEDINKAIESSMTDANINSLIEKTVTGIKQHLPMQITADVTLTNCESKANQTLVYTYVMANLDTKKFDSIPFKEYSKSSSIQMLKGNESFVNLLKMGITCVYVYKDYKENYLCQVELTSKDF